MVEYAKAADTELSNSSTEETHFECIICLCTAREPVVTQCGHLFCWSCMHTWLVQPRETLTCPFCKSGIDRAQIRPIYTRGDGKQENR